MDACNQSLVEVEQLLPLIEPVLILETFMLLTPQ